MTLASSLGRSVKSPVRNRGLHYFRGRRVSLLSCGPWEAKAVVTGTTRYEVALTREGKRVRGSCSCPFFADRDTPCKHIWATVLAVDTQSGLRGDGRLPSTLITMNTPGPEVRAKTGNKRPRRSRRGGPAAQNPAAQSPVAPGLRAVTDPLPQPARTARTARPHGPPAGPPAGHPAQAPVRAGELLYVIDLGMSLSRQRLTMEILTRRRKRDGSSGALGRTRLNRSSIAQLRNPVDREILALLAEPADRPRPEQPRRYGGPGERADRGDRGDRTEIPSPCEIPESAMAALLPLLCSTGRCRLRRDTNGSGPGRGGERGAGRRGGERGGERGEPLSWDGATPWQLWLEVREEVNGDGSVIGVLRRGEERMSLAEPALLMRSGLMIAGNRISRLEAEGAYNWIPLLRGTGTFRVPAAETEELLERLLTSPALPRLDLPESLRIVEVRPPAQPRLRLLPPSGVGPARDWPCSELSFFYDGREVAAGALIPGLYQKEGRRFLFRDSRVEQQAAVRLEELGFRPDSEGVPEKFPMQIPPGRVPDVVRTLLAEGWSVETQGKLYRAPGSFRLSVSSGLDWFELHGGAVFESAGGGETVRLPALLAAVRRGDSYVLLGDGTFGAIPEEWLKKLAPVTRMAHSEADHLRFQPTQAALLDAWLSSEPEATWDAAFEESRERLRGFSGITPAEAPAQFRGTLRGYQKAGLGWLHFLRDFGFGGCLADDMGLGKTVQVLALLEARRERRAAEGLPPSLVVVPRSLIFNWLAEAAQFTPELKVLDFSGAGRARHAGEDDAFAAFADFDLVLTTYGTLRKDIAALRQTEFDYVILDEAQAIKNSDSQTAKAARLLHGRHRLALTGTPVENHLGELWSLLEFLNPGLMGPSSQLRTQATVRNPGQAERELLARALRPFILRRTKEQVAADLPAKVEQTLLCELPPKQRRLYDELRDHYRDALGKKIGENGMGRVKILVLEALLRLRQAACHPALLDPERADEPCAKLDLLVPQLREIIDEGHKALVFSQFTTFLGLLRRQLDAEGIPYLYLDGRTRDRQERVEKFQSDPECPLFLISLKAGGLGLNLTAADYVYLLDPWWNPAVEAQAIDRAHRIGQTRPVFASRLVARDTVEEKILELQKSKRALADAIIQADQSLIAGLSREDLELLLS